MSYEYILFDLDGTLTESSMGIINSVIYALNMVYALVPIENESVAYNLPVSVPLGEKDDYIQIVKKILEVKSIGE